MLLTSFCGSDARCGLRPATSALSASSCECANRVFCARCLVVEVELTPRAEAAGVFVRKENDACDDVCCVCGCGVLSGLKAYCIDIDDASVMSGCRLASKVLFRSTSARNMDCSFSVSATFLRIASNDSGVGTSEFGEDIGCRSCSRG